jgi:hypothetical protein
MKGKAGMTSKNSHSGLLWVSLSEFVVPGDGIVGTLYPAIFTRIKDKTVSLKPTNKPTFSTLPGWD